MPLTDDLIARLERKAPAMAAFLGLLTGENADLSLDQFRAGYAQVLQAFPVPPGVRFEAVDMGGVAAIRAIPADVESERALLFAHGGACVIGEPEGYRSLGAAFAVAARAIVYLPAYRLVPEHPFPVPLRDVFAAYRWLLERGHNPHDVAIVGDAAGGAMAVSVMAMVRDAGLSLPAGAVALSPWANLEHTGRSMVTRKDRDIVHAPVPGCWEIMAKAVLAGAPANSPELSPVFADVRGLPPVLIQVGEAEQLLSDAVRLAGHLGGSGVRVTLEVWPDMFFGWHMYHAELAEAAEAIGSAARFLDTAFARGTVDLCAPAPGIGGRTNGT